MACRRDLGLALIDGVNYKEAVRKPSINWSFPLARITSEVQNGRQVGLLPTYLYPLIHGSPIGLVPKPHSDKFRMIVDLSAPRGQERIYAFCGTLR